MYDLELLFLLFIFYSFIGWLIDIIDIAIVKQKIVNRGFLIGPYCPIYGVGALLMLIFLYKYKYDPFVLFGMSFLICGLLEYFTSYIMEKLFKARWWDYSDYRFNLNGRICLLNLILFGIGGVLLFYVLNPFILFIINHIPQIILNIIAIILFFIFISDVFISLKVISEVKKLASTVKKDSTDEINKKIRNVLEKKSILYRRLSHAFPNIHVKIKYYNNKLKKKRIAK